MKYLGELRERFRGAAVFTLSDIRIFLKSKGISRDYLGLMVHNLLASGELKRITRGAYTFRDEAQVVGFAFSPFYYGLQDALSLRNLWEQETNPVVITPRAVRAGLRAFEGVNYLIRRIGRKMFFGFDMLKYWDFWIPVSNPEKTLIDFAYFREPLGKDALKELERRISRPKLLAYLRRSPPYVKKSVGAMLGLK